MNNILLTPGDLAPQFSVTDAFGETINMSDYKNQHVLLVFLRYAGCPLCNLTVHRLILEYPLLTKNGCKVISFIQSDAASIKRNVYSRQKNRPQFPIVPDPGKTYYDQYGVHSSKKALAKSLLDIPYWLKSAIGEGFKQTEIDGDLLMVPATFLVGPGDQKIVKAEYSSSFYDHRTFTEIYEPLIFKDPA